MDILDKRTRADQIFSKLKERYPNAGCELNYRSPFELLVAVILSAQCTDTRVNMITNELFKVANSPADFAKMPLEELEKYIYSCGFYRNKAKNIKSAAIDILQKFNGQVPDNLKDLMSLAGVGRKTANVILSVAFNKEAIAVDTHVFRVSHRLDLSRGKTPDDVEKDLTQLFCGNMLGSVHHLLIFHGRYCCYARRPNCKECPVIDFCPYLNKTV